MDIRSLSPGAPGVGDGSPSPDGAASPTSPGGTALDPPSPETTPYCHTGKVKRRGQGRQYVDYQPSEPTVSQRLADGKALINAIEASDMMMAQGILLAGGDPNTARDREGRTALHIAADRGTPGLCRHLINARANLDEEVANTRHTALHIATLTGHFTVVKMLLAAAANPNKVNWRPAENARLR